MQSTSVIGMKKGGIGPCFYLYRPNIRRAHGRKIACPRLQRFDRAAMVLAALLGMPLGATIGVLVSLSTLDDMCRIHTRQFA